jgi:hypothetical protein
MRITEVSKGRLILKPVNLEFEFPADSVDGLIQ